MVSSLVIAGKELLPGVVQRAPAALVHPVGRRIGQVKDAVTLWGRPSPSRPSSAARNLCGRSRPAVRAAADIFGNVAADRGPTTTARQWPAEATARSNIHPTAGRPSRQSNLQSNEPCTTKTTATRLSTRADFTQKNPSQTARAPERSGRLPKPFDGTAQHHHQLRHNRLPAPGTKVGSRGFAAPAWLR